MRFIHDLSPETQRLLRRCYKESQHHRVRQRAHCILLSFAGKTTTELMRIFAVNRLTIYHWFAAWDRSHFAGLYDRKGRGRPPKLTHAEQETAYHYVTQYPQDLKKVVHLLEQATSKRVSTKTIKRLLKKTRVAKSAGVRSLQASRDMMRDPGGSADNASAAGGGSLVPAAALARP